MDSQTDSTPKAEPLQPVSLWHMIKVTSWGMFIQQCEDVSNNFISPLARDLVRNAAQVGWIQSLNPLFGILVQPIIGWLGDHTWTRIGRRKPYLLLALPWLLVTLIAIPVAHRFDSLLWFVVAVAIYQLFVDMYGISAGLMMPETVPAQQRSRASSIMMMGRAAISILAVTIVAKYYDINPLIPLSFAAIVGIVSTSVLVFGVKEHRHAVQTRRMSFRSFPADIFKYGLKNRNILIMYLIAVFVSYGENSINAFYTLFCREELGVPVGEAVRIMYIRWIAILLVAVPLGQIADRIGKRKVLVFGQVMVIIAALFGLTAQSLTQMKVFLALSALAMTAHLVSYYPLMTQYMPRGRFGTISGAIPLFYGGARFLAMLTVGIIIDAFGENYRVIWYIAIACTIPALTLILMLDPPKTKDVQPN